MTPGTVVLLHGPFDGAAVWADLPERLRARGLDVIAPDLLNVEGTPYVARASLVIAATDPRPPLLLVGHAAVGPLLPAIAAAQRAAHRAVGGYLFVDADLPTPEQGADWPDAPCGYLMISPDRERDAKVAGMRDWPVTRHDSAHDLADTLHAMITSISS